MVVFQTTKHASVYTTLTLTGGLNLKGTIFLKIICYLTTALIDKNSL